MAEKMARVWLQVVKNEQGPPLFIGKGELFKIQLWPLNFWKIWQIPCKVAGHSLVEEGKIFLEQDTCHLMLGSWNYDVIIPNKDDVII